MSDVLNAPVYTQDVANSAGLGAAYQAAKGMMSFLFFQIRFPF